MLTLPRGKACSQELADLKSKKYHRQDVEESEGSPRELAVRREFLLPVEGLRGVLQKCGGFMNPTSL